MRKAIEEEEIRIAIAEACGIKPPYTIKREGRWVAEKVIWTIPDYTSDLNAMARAEQTLTESQKCVYAETLCAILKEQVVDWGYYPGEGTIEWNSIAAMVFATARQRAEAFLRTIGKWKSRMAVT